MTVEVLEPHGFCRGVEQALRLTEEALAAGTLYCVHPPVHNEIVTDGLKAKGLVLVPSLADIPDNGTVLFSAHGTRPEAVEEARERGLAIIDATCPFVARLHRQARTFAMRGVPVIVVGHASHVEVQGVVGEIEYAGGTVRVIRTEHEVATLDFPVNATVGVLCQTTFDAAMSSAIMSALSTRYPRLELPPASDVCTATRDRQDAVRRFVRSGGDGVLVLGSTNSSNTTRLIEIARAEGVCFVVRAASASEAAKLDFNGVSRLGVTSGASTPESLLADVLAMLRS